MEEQAAGSSSPTIDTAALPDWIKPYVDFAVANGLYSDPQAVVQDLQDTMQPTLTTVPHFFDLAPDTTFEPVLAPDPSVDDGAVPFTFPDVPTDTSTAPVTDGTAAQTPESPAPDSVQAQDNTEYGY